MNSTSSTRGDLQRMEAAADWLQRLHVNPGDEPLLSEWLEWCQADARNLLEFQRLQAIWEGAGSVDSVLSAAADASPKDPRPARRWAIPMSLAAAMLLAVGLLSWSPWTMRSVNEGRVFETTTAQRGAETLQDGSRIELGARTRIATKFSAAQREVMIESGEAFFEVAKDAHRPFIVKAGDLRVTAVGTAFSVRRRAERTVVTVTEGVIRVTTAPGTSGSIEGSEQNQVQAGVGQEVTFVEPERSLRMVRVDPKLATSWREGVLKFVNEPLSSVVADLNRYSKHRVVLMDAALADRPFTGTIYENRIDDWLLALEGVFAVRVVREGDVIRLISRSDFGNPAGIASQTATGAPSSPQ